MTTMNDADIVRRKRAFRTAFDYLEHQIELMPAYASPEKYFEQAVNELCELGNGTEDELSHGLLVDAYIELERIWMQDRSGDAYDTGRAG